MALSIEAQRKKEEEQWQAESDARMLVNYQELLDDKPRLRRAIKQAKKDEERFNKQAKAAARAAGISPEKGK